MQIWPADLPAPIRDDYGVTLGDNRRFTQGDAGPPRPKGNRSKPTRGVAMTLIATRNQLARFERFRDDVGYGAVPFLMPDYGTHGWGLASEDGAPLMTEGGGVLLLDAWFTCLFGQRAPAISVTGLNFRITFDLLVLPR
jgi:hypothetical protein